MRAVVDTRPFVRRLTALEKNADDKTRGGKAGCPSASSAVPATGAALDSPDDLLTNSLATLDDDAYADRLKVQCKRTLSNPTTPTGTTADAAAAAAADAVADAVASAAAAAAENRYPVRPPS